MKSSAKNSELYYQWRVCSLSDDSFLTMPYNQVITE